MCGVKAVNVDKMSFMLHTTCFECVCVDVEAHGVRASCEGDLLAAILGTAEKKGGRVGDGRSRERGKVSGLSANHFSLSRSCTLPLLLAPTLRRRSTT